MDMLAAKERARRLKFMEEKWKKVKEALNKSRRPSQEKSKWRDPRNASKLYNTVKKKEKDEK